MLFNSLEFALFLPIVFILYWLVFNRNVKLRNAFLILVSYVFYGWWDWRFLFLIALSSIVDFFAAQYIDRHEEKAKRKLGLWISVAVNLGVLGFFKYFNFFAHSFVEMLDKFGMEASYTTLKVILPVGISFYTFQTMSYTIDVYKKRVKSTKDPFAFFAFVSFFPQLVAGPIERAKSLLPQFEKTHKIGYEDIQYGMRLILWGLFMKIVIADTCGTKVDYIFANYQLMNSGDLFISALYFSFQIYCDFAGYSYIAVGVAALFGFDLMYNFNYPAFSRNIAEFWRRWHISLSTWFRDYVFQPLGGLHGNNWKRLRNIMALFVTMGFWHGANWTFVIWGIVIGLAYFIWLQLPRERRMTKIVAEHTMLPSVKEFFQMVGSYSFITLSLILFRSPDIGVSIDFFTKMATENPFVLRNPNNTEYLYVIPILLVIEWIGRRRRFPLDFSDKVPAVLRWFLYVIFAYFIAELFFGRKVFIYFQF